MKNKLIAFLYALIGKLVEQIENLQNKPPVVVPVIRRFDVAWKLFDQSHISLIIKNPTMLELKDSQQASAVITPLDKRSQPTTLGTPIAATSSDENVATVEVTPVDPAQPNGPANVTAKAVGIGTAQINFEATDADGNKITDFAAVEVKAGNAAGFGIQWASPIEQPETPPAV